MELAGRDVCLSVLLPPSVTEAPQTLSIKLLPFARIS